jgi:regulator of protease activity HflC (stomatin/prohibitin superfamily)
MPGRPEPVRSGSCFLNTAALAALLAIKTVRVIPQARAANVERFGRYRSTLQAGLNFVVPVLDRIKPLIDLREQVVSFEDQPVITEATWWSTSTPCCSSR